MFGVFWSGGQGEGLNKQGLEGGYRELNDDPDHLSPV